MDVLDGRFFRREASILNRKPNENNGFDTFTQWRSWDRDPLRLLFFPGKSRVKRVFGMDVFWTDVSDGCFPVADRSASKTDSGGKSAMPPERAVSVRCGYNATRKSGNRLIYHHPPVRSKFDRVDGVSVRRQMFTTQEGPARKPKIGP
jgi:hypothetical protein